MGHNLEEFSNQAYDPEDMDGDFTVSFSNSHGISKTQYYTRDLIPVSKRQKFFLVCGLLNIVQFCRGAASKGRGERGAKIKKLP